MGNFATLEEMLETTYGPGNYLTPARMDKGDGIVITPRPDFNAFADVSPRPAQGRWTEDLVNHGDMSFSLGTFPITGQLMPRGFDGAFIYAQVIKEPGSDAHRVPPEFPELAFPIQAFANYTYATDQFAPRKIMGMGLRILPMKEGTRQIGTGWHIHKPFQLNDTFRKRAGFFEVPARELEVIGEISPRLLQTEAYISNMAPTRIQTRRSEQLLHTRETPLEYLIEGTAEWPVPGRQPAPYELVTGSAAAYHTAATIAQADIGKTRMLLILSSIPTKELEAEYGLG